MTAKMSRKWSYAYFYGWFYKLALSDFEIIFEFKLQVEEGA